MSKMEHEFELMDASLQSIEEHLEGMTLRWKNWPDSYRKAYLVRTKIFRALAPAFDAVAEGRLHRLLVLFTIKDRERLSSLSVDDQERIITSTVPVVDAITRKVRHLIYGEMTDNQKEAVIDVANGKLRSPYEQGGYYTDRVKRAVEPPPVRKPAWEWNVIGSGEHVYIDLLSPVKLAIPAKHIRKMYLDIEAHERELAAKRGR